MAVRVLASLKDLSSVEAQQLKIDRWPVVTPPANSFVVSGEGSLLRVLLPKAKSGEPSERLVRFESAPLKMQTTIRVRDIDAGSASATVFIRGRTLELPLMQARLFDADMLASARVNIDDPHATVGDLALRNVDPTRMLELVPSLYGLTGRFDLYATVQPDSNPHALEPLVVDVTFDSHGLAYRQLDKPAAAGSATRPAVPLTTPATAAALPGLDVGDGRFRALLRLTNRFEVERGVLADQSGIYRAPDDRKRPIGVMPPNTLQLAGGRFTFWGRMINNHNDRNREGFDTRTLHGRVAFEALDLNQVLQAADPDGIPTPGLIDGSFILYGTTRTDEALISPTALATSAGAGKPPTTLTEKTIAALQGEGQVRVRQADIANVGIISALYNLLRIGGNYREPTGYGAASFRIEDNHAYLTAARYFNRGLEVRATAQIAGLHRLRDATIRGDAFGSIRALKDVEIPIIRSLVPDIDEILSAVQSSGVSVTFAGPITDPDPQPVLFRDLGDSLRELILGDYRDTHNNRGP
jgi:hypothetical protein